jgi:hypothetical protein
MDEKNRALHHAAILAREVDRVAHLRSYGSFADRNPVLGKMTRCPHCRTRRREFAPKCCSFEYVVENSNTVARSFYARKRKNPRLTRKRPPFFLIHQLLVEIEQDRRPELENVRKEHLAGYVEAVIAAQIKERKRRARNQQKRSRRANRK